MEIMRLNRPRRRPQPAVLVIDRSRLVCRILACMQESNVKLIARRSVASAVRWLENHPLRTRAIAIEAELLPQLDPRTIKRWQDRRWIILYGAGNHNFRKYLSGCPDITGLRKPIMTHRLKHALAGIGRI